MNRRPFAVALLTLTVGLAPAISPETGGIGGGYALIAQNDANSALPILRLGARGDRVRWLQGLLNGRQNDVCWWWKPCRTDFRVAVDGRFGPDTRHAVVLFQRQQSLAADGIVGPRTWAALNDPRPPCDMVREALVGAGASSWETDFGVRVSRRETGCRLLHVLRPSTKDNTYGGFGVNYYGELMGPRSAWLGPPSVNMTWPGSAQIFLKLGRESGWCHWDGPNYCAG